MKPILFLLLALAAPAQELDGPKQIFRDDLLDRMAGAWKLTGNIHGRAVVHSVKVEWILNHQFLQIHEKDTADEYEALALIGYDNMSERYVIHWNDVFGGRFSETLGYGARSGNEVAFRFEYPDGPFQSFLRWLPEKRQWQWAMRSKNAKGQWEEFGSMTLTPASRETAVP